MLPDLKQLGKQTAIYGIGDVIGRLSTFLLLPIYTNFLSLGEFGTLEIFYMTSAILTIFLGRQLSHAALRFYFEYDTQTDRNRVISSAFLSFLFFTGSLLAICMVFASRFSIVLFSSPEYTVHFCILFTWLFFNLSKEILLAYVRALERAKFFVSVSLCDLLIKLLLCTYLVVVMELGVLGVLLGNLAGSLFAWLILSVFTIVRCGIKIDFSKSKELFVYALPLFFVGISGTVISNADRFFIKSYISLEAVGLYALGFRFATILRFLVIQPFTKGYGPFRFKIMKQDNASEIYARVTTYFTFGCAWAAVGIAAFASETIQIMSHENYWSANTVIPMLLLAVFGGSGLYYMFQTGLYIQRNTNVLSVLFAVAAGIDIFSLWLLVPRFGILGAAFSQLIAYTFIACSSLYLSNRAYKIPFEWHRLLKIIGLCCAYISATFFTYHPTPYWSVAIKIPVFFSYPVVLFLYGILNQEEKEKLLSIIRQAKNKFIPKKITDRL
jgi:O-antigen/teichoic acid export membrane protein